MARMDVTPQELRGSEIKEAFRGFNRDEVDDLLERAAATIENLTHQVQELESRATNEPAPLPSSRDDAEMLQRTLLLAQRAADDAVNEAQAHARQLIEESEARAQALVERSRVHRPPHRRRRTPPARRGDHRAQLASRHALERRRRARRVRVGLPRAGTGRGRGRPRADRQPDDRAAVDAPRGARGRDPRLALRASGGT